MRTVLSIAASDPSAGAGIQQDLKTITALGAYGMTAITALTAQNTCGVTAVSEVSPAVLRQQLDALTADIEIHAVKTGIIPSTAAAQEIERTLQLLHVPTVLDPVLVSTSGWPFLNSECIAYIAAHLFPLCTLVTPNLPEALQLAQLDAGEATADNSSPTPDYATAARSLTPAAIERLGMDLAQRHKTAFLMKGGHSDSGHMTDILCCPDGSTHAYTTPRISTRNLHGTGCTLSSAIATLLAQHGSDLPLCIKEAKAFIQHAIANGSDLCIGHGNGPLWVF